MSCHHIYTGTHPDGGIKGHKCGREPDEHVGGENQRKMIDQEMKWADGLRPLPNLKLMHHPYVANPICGLFQIHFHGRTFGIVVEDGMVTEAAPSGKTFIGQPWGCARSWYLRKGATINRVRES